MIRLTLNPKTEPQIHLFNKSAILIGAESSEVDITLPELDLQAIHLKIFEQNGFLIIANIAHDPFISLNGHPFGKKLLKTGDLILVHHTEILFEYLVDSSMEKSILNQKDQNRLVSVYQAVENKIQPSDRIRQELSSRLSQSSDSFLSVALPFEKDVQALQEEEWKTSDMEGYLKDIEPFSNQTTSETEDKAPIAQEARKKPTSLKDDYLSEWDDENQNLSIGLHPTEQNHLYHAWKWIIFFIFSVLTIAAIIGTVIYLTVSDNTEAQEVKVAQGMSDIAMALMHAQLHHLKPHNQNWSDVDFIKTNLQSILPQSYSYATEIDTQGQFNCCAYSLRIYTSSDLSRFLLIAQPAPSLLHWLIPKSVILVDSENMELRSIKDLRSLNRLLATPDPLEGLSGKEILSLVKQGELIRLASLASEDRHIEFIPPKHLAWVKPGAENLIYNAPRYYRLGQTLIEKALILSNSKGTSQEVSALREDIESFSRLNHLVLYTNQGKKYALLIKQAIATFAPSDKILFGYLTQAQGKTTQAHLIKEEEEINESPSLIAAASKEEETKDALAMQDSPSKAEPVDLPLRPNEEHKQVDKNHPIYIQLNALSTTRENELRPLVQSLTDLLHQETANPTYHFQEEFQHLSHQYLMANARHKQKIKEALSALYYQYDEMPILQFIELVKSVGFEQLIQHDDQSFTLADENCLQNLETMSTHIENAKTLVELDNLIEIASSWLSFDHIQNAQDLLRYQNLLRNKVLSQLEKLLLTHPKQLDHQSLKEEEKTALNAILNRERVVYPDEREFFLEEFNRLFEQTPPNQLDIDS